MFCIVLHITALGGGAVIWIPFGDEESKSYGILSLVHRNSKGVILSHTVASEFEL